MTSGEASEIREVQQQLESVRLLAAGSSANPRIAPVRVAEVGGFQTASFSLQGVLFVFPCWS